MSWFYRDIKIAVFQLNSAGLPKNSKISNGLKIIFVLSVIILIYVHTHTLSVLYTSVQEDLWKRKVVAITNVITSKVLQQKAHLRKNYNDNFEFKKGTSSNSSLTICMLYFSFDLNLFLNQFWFSLQTLMLPTQCDVHIYPNGCHYIQKTI